MNDVIITLGNNEVFAKRYSISQREHYESAIQGLEPEYRFDIWFFEYNGVKELEYNGVKYAIYRTFQKGEYIELYTQKQLGVV